eukprot:Amastigsp_a340986_26.p3 type:complete len:130 gc:universal Amastigsp_a340986_26:520-131(-)
MSVSQFTVAPGAAVARSDSEMGASRARSCCAALRVAATQHSEPIEPPVTPALGMAFVVVGTTRMISKGTERTSDAACAHLTLMPCPISVPVCCRMIEPSCVHTDIVHPIGLPENPIPNLIGTIEMPRLT